MSEYMPPFKITNEILTYIASVSEKIGKISAVSNLESKQHLRKNTRSNEWLYSIWEDEKHKPV